MWIDKIRGWEKRDLPFVLLPDSWIGASIFSALSGLKAWTGIYTTGLLCSQAFGRGLDYTTSFLGSFAYSWQISLHNCESIPYKRILLLLSLGNTNTGFQGVFSKFLCIDVTPDWTPRNRFSSFLGLAAHSFTLTNLFIIWSQPTSPNSFHVTRHLLCSSLSNSTNLFFSYPNLSHSFLTQVSSGAALLASTSLPSAAPLHPSDLSSDVTGGEDP